MSSIGRFRRNLRILQCTSPTLGPDGFQHLPESWAKEATRLAQLRRRRRLAQGLLGLMGTTLVLGLIPTFHFLLVAHVFLDIAFLGYIGMLVQARRLQIADRKRTRLAASRLRAEYAARLAHEPDLADVQHQAL